MNGDFSSNEQAELLSPPWFAAKVSSMTTDVRAFLLRHKVPLSELPQGSQLAEGQRARAEYLRDKLLRERGNDPRLNWLKKAAWYQDVTRAASRLSLPYF